ncbi:high-affinity Zn(2+) transporter zrt1 [Mortierella claussenii]|nr:high-affinity Zn(2+) transporter zrt1 [Mortierella claussenii]
MRLSFSSKVTAMAAVLMFIANVPIISSADALAVCHSMASSSDSLLAASEHTVRKRAGEGHDHDHDHDHPPPSTTTSALGTPVPTAPAHSHDHDHDHDHNHGDEGLKEGKIEDDHDHDHGSEEAGHSHGPARTCEAHDHDHGEYVVWHHIIALLVLTVVAGLGCVLPMLLRDSPRTRFAVQAGKYFGAGVVLSVAFVHIMPEALFALTHPCLSKAWTDDYPGYAPLIMMMAGLSMLVIEFLASTLVMSVDAQSKSAAAAAAASGSAGSLESSHSHGDHWDARDHKAADAGHAMDELSSPTDHHHHHPTTAAAVAATHKDESCSHAHGLTLLQCGPGVSTKLSTYMLELGITLHSVFIGIALGVLAGSEFLAMTIAICFHQFFEGIALGARIADLSFAKKWIPLLLVLAFALVTPLGVAIGMGVRSGYTSNSVENLITMGVFNSIACGVLLYTAFVTLLGGDILYSERFRAESRNHKACYLIAVWLGAISMAVLALWA